MGFASQPPHLEWKSRCHGRRHGCCRGHRCIPATPPPLFNTPTVLSSPPPKYCEWLVVVFLRFCLLIFAHCAAPAYTNSCFLPTPHAHWEATTAFPAQKKQQRKKQQWVFLFKIPLHQIFHHLIFLIKLLLPDEPPLSPPQLHHTPATSAHQSHHPPAIEWGRQ